MKTLRSLLAVLIMTAGLGRGTAIFDVTLDTAGLSTGGAYSLVFALIDGSGADDGNNSVVIANLLSGSPSCQFGGCTISSSPLTLTLADTAFYSQVDLVGIDVSSPFTFRVSASDNPDPDGLADSFAFWLLQGSDVIPTIAPDGISLLSFDINVAGASLLTYPSDGVLYPYVTMSAPQTTLVSDPAGSVPEPSTLLLLSAGFGLMAWARIRGRH